MEFQYDHETYWPAMNKLADERRAAYQERWVRGGKRVGEVEGYLKGGSERCLAEMEGVNGDAAVQQVNGQAGHQTNGLVETVIPPQVQA